MDSGKDIKWVKIYTAMSLDEANIVKGLLESNGIRCFMKEFSGSSVYPSLASSEGIPLLVLEKDETVALELISKEVKIEGEEM